jgi:hypothetical protein
MGRGHQARLFELPFRKELATETRSSNDQFPLLFELWIGFSEQGSRKPLETLVIAIRDELVTSTV